MGFFTAFGKFRKMMSLFKKERKIFNLFSDITGDVSDGFRKEVDSSISKKTEVLVKDIRYTVNKK
jgi:hypothetical protein